MANSPNTIEQGLATWVSTAIPGLTVVVAGQDHARPPTPFATVNVLSDNDEGTAHQVLTDTAGSTDASKFTTQVTQGRSGTVSIRIVGPSSYEKIRQLRASIYDFNVGLVNRGNNLTIRNSIGVTRTFPASSAGTESVSQSDFAFAYKDVFTYEVEDVQTVNATGQDDLSDLDPINETL